jgi:hypothetical protein
MGTAVLMDGDVEFDFLFRFWLAWYNLPVIFIIFSKNPTNTLQYVPTTSKPHILVSSSPWSLQNEVKLINLLLRIGNASLYHVLRTGTIYQWRLDYMHDRSGVRIPVGVRNCFAKFPGRLWGPTQPPIQCFRGYFPALRGRRHKTTHIHLSPGLELSGAIPLLPLYAFIAWTGKTSLHLYHFPN